jgi:phosphatidylserine decarboxylase
MYFHKEGYKIMAVAFTALFILNIIAIYFLAEYSVFVALLLLFSIVFFFLIVQFFRVPIRKITSGDSLIIAPCDGKVVVIEQVQENEYFKDARWQISIFMSPLNVHANWFPIGGIVKYAKYHPGKYLVAWHPKSSTENERTTVVVEKKPGTEVLFRQIAGAVARRIIYYCKAGDTAQQGSEFGFIKFGSRVDIFLPTTAKIKVAIDRKTVGQQTIIAEF